MKLCSVCNMVLKFEHFSKSKTGHLGYQASCKSCSQIRRKAYNDKRMMSKEGHIRNILTKIKSRAKLKNLAFDLDFEYLISIVTENCPILNTQLAWCSRTDNPVPESPSLDRLVPEKGYVKGNVSWVSHKANRIKNDASLEDLKKLIVWVEKQCEM